MTSPVVLCVRRTDAPTHTHRRCKRHSGDSSLHDMPLVDKGCQHQPGFGMAAFSTTTRCLAHLLRSYSHSPPGKKRTDSNHRQIQRRVSVCLVCLGLFHWLQLNWCLATGCMMTSRLHQETKVSCWSMPPELSGVPVPMMRLKTIQKGIQVPLGSEFEMG